MSKVNLDGLNKKLEHAAGAKKSIMKQAYQYFVELTPIKTGNAKQSTRLNNDNIEAKYPYAAVLDKGRHMTNRGMRGSTQAPNGMSNPTIKKFQQWIKNYIKLG